MPELGGAINMTKMTYINPPKIILKYDSIEDLKDGIIALIMELEECTCSEDAECDHEQNIFFEPEDISTQLYLKEMSRILNISSEIFVKHLDNGFYAYDLEKVKKYLELL